MLKIGFIDLDTSHPRSFVKRLNAMPGVRVSGVYDRGRKKGRLETLDFCREFAVTEHFSVEELCEACDGIMVLSADWATHFEDVCQCMRAGRPCYCDKPVFASRAEIGSFLQLAAETGTRFLGGSGWRWNKRTQGFYESTKGSVVGDVLISGQNELFYYGIHAVDWLLGLLGPGAEWIKYERRTPDLSYVSLGHRRGCTVRMLLETTPETGRLFWAKADGQEYFLSLDGDDIHDGICGSFVEMLRTGRQPGQYAEYLESLLVLFALEESRITGQRIEIASAQLVPGFDSAAFMAEYCKA
ncbi:MAG: Gfo/Idh/MocA family oxidoreductase [Oligosphaeraceae bacterium]|nr:Gfo/Idh/MocA family oxidoreductase [Oligosphaeraceae bacterium]